MNDATMPGLSGAGVPEQPARSPGARGAALAAITASRALFEADVCGLAREVTELTARATGVERASVWLFNEDGSLLECVDLYTGSARRHCDGMVLRESQFRNEFRILREVPYVNADDVLTDPRTAGYVSEYIKPLGITAMLDAAIRVSGRLLGVFCLEHVGRAHHWELDEIAFACWVADSLALAIINRERGQAVRRAVDGERRFRALIENASDLIAVVAPDGTLSYLSPSVERLAGYLPDELLGRRYLDFAHPDDREKAAAVFARVRAEPGGIATNETRFRRKDGAWVLLQSIARNAIDEPAAGGIIVNARDITEGRRAEQRVAKLNRLRSALSAVNRAIVHATDDQALYEAVCSIAVRHAGFVLAWIGRPSGRSDTVVPVASAGSDAALACLARGPGSCCAGEFTGGGLTAIALGEGRPAIVNDVLTDAAMAAWRETACAIGIRSLAAYPLRQEGKTVAVLNVHADTLGYFDDEITALLEEMAQDVSYALDVRAGEQARRATAEALRESEARFRAMVEQSISGCYVIQDGRFAFVNARFAEIFGYAGAREIVGRSPLDLVAPGDRARVSANLRSRLEGRVKSLGYEFRGLRADGREIEVGVHGGLALYGGRPAVLGLLQDISVRKRAEEEIRNYVARLEQSMQSTIEVVTKMGELRDPYTRGHERRVGELAAAIATEMALPADRVEGIRIAGYLHDVGKIAVPAEILVKPTRLSQAEFALVKDHAQHSHEILSTVSFPWPVAEAAWQHHERLDGSGYPRGLAGEAIILEARVLAVADVVEAMASHRPYRPGLGVEAALAEIERNRGRLYCPDAVDACLRLCRDRSYAIPS